MTSDYIWLNRNIKGNRIGIIAFTGLKSKVKLSSFCIYIMIRNCRFYNVEQEVISGSYSFTVQWETVLAFYNLTKISDINMYMEGRFMLAHRFRGFSLGLLILLLLVLQWVSKKVVHLMEAKRQRKETKYLLERVFPFNDITLSLGPTFLPLPTNGRESGLLYTWVFWGKTYLDDDRE